MVVVRPEWLFDSVMAGEALGLGAYRHSPACVSRLGSAGMKPA